MHIDLLNIALRCIYMNIISMIIFFKINNYKDFNLKKKIIISICIIISSLVYIICRNKLDIVTSIIILCSIQTIFLKFIIKLGKYNIVLGVIISNSFALVIMVASAILEYIIQKVININNNTINVLLSELIGFMLIYYFTRIKRIKNGFDFLQKQNEYFEITLMNISIILVLVYELVIYKGYNIYKNLFFYYILLGILTVLIVQKTIVMYQKQKLIRFTIEDYKKQLEEKDNEIKKLTDEAFRISKINHEFYNRQKSLELMVKTASQKQNIEAGEEFDILGKIQALTSEHAKEVEEAKSLPVLQSTEIPEIDNMFKYMQKECLKSKIEFKLQINGNIHYLINNLISKNKLETLIGDHIRDAIIAIDSSSNTYKEILVILGIKDECYELDIYDTGIEFEIETLSKLGIVPATTHKDTGGSGIGFITTFETLKECKASLIIEEIDAINKNGYTKAVKIRFDGKNEYKICSYRAEKLKANITDKRAIICERL